MSVSTALIASKPKRDRRFPLKKQRKLLDQLQNVAVELGAIKLPGDRMYPWVLPTRFGDLHMSFSEGYYLASVFCRFENPSAAVHLLCNPYTGKWNFHFNDKDAAVTFYVNDFRDRLTAIVRRPSEAVRKKVKSPGGAKASADAKRK